MIKTLKKLFNFKQNRLQKTKSNQKQLFTKQSKNNSSQKSNLNENKQKKRIKNIKKEEKGIINAKNKSTVIINNFNNINYFFPAEITNRELSQKDEKINEIFVKLNDNDDNSDVKL